MSSALGFRAVASGPDAYAGTMNLSVGRAGGRSRPVRTESSGVLRLMKPLHLDDSGQVAYFVVNPGGAYFSEACRMDVEVLADANLLLSSQGATRIYRTPRGPAVQEAHFTVRSGGRLEYVPDQLIAYRDADYRQVTTITMAPDAQVFVEEIVTPGWDPDGTPFTYAGMLLRMEVHHVDGGLVCADNVRIVPGDIGAAIDGIGYMEGASHMGNVLILGQHVGDAYVEAVREVVDTSGLTTAGVTSGSRHGIPWVMVRALASSTDTLSAMVLAINEHDRAVTTGQGRLHLRRY
ncbi:urease accessory protein UreD [Ammonicoccus fulvus]|uniref:Urease accessory protein UreD n=1 Tax=Ammonicoccus fulvus TaxID=3138240 RepID=A0ABZ3FW43_9ACTN